jgi:hypothetical protein
MYSQSKTRPGGGADGLIDSTLQPYSLLFLPTLSTEKERSRFSLKVKRDKRDRE